MTQAILTDWHAHLLPVELTEALKGRSIEPFLRENDSRRFLHARAGADPMASSPGLFSVEQRIADLDRAGIDVQVLSVAGLMGVDSAADDGVDDLVERTNRGLARVVNEHPDRFRSLASVPLRDPSRAADVLEHAVKDLGHLGAILSVDAFLTEESAAAFRPVLERANALGAHLFIHPGPLPGAPRAKAAAHNIDKLRYSVTGIQNGITEAAITLEFTDSLAGLDNLTVHVANLAGNLAYLAGRWKHTQQRLGEEVWDGRLKRILVDTASLGPDAVRFAAKTFGADRLLFGTDAPIYGVDEPAREARELGIGLTAQLEAA